MRDGITRRLATARPARYNRTTSMPERRPPADSSSGARGAAPGEPEAAGKTARTLPLGSAQAEVRARTAARAGQSGEPLAANAQPAPRAPFPDQEQAVKRPYPNWESQAQDDDA